MRPGNQRVEGPFGEWTGYYASDIRPEPVLDIKAIYYRNNPIILGCPPQRPPSGNRSDGRETGEISRPVWR